MTAGSPPRIGILLPLFGSSFAELREGARRDEAAGLDDVWVSDHLQSVPDAAAPVLEGWTTLVALAEATERIGLGSLVLSATFREPRVLARSVETLVDVEIAFVRTHKTSDLQITVEKSDKETYGRTYIGRLVRRRRIIVRVSFF